MLMLIRPFLCRLVMSTQGTCTLCPVPCALCPVPCALCPVPCALYHVGQHVPSFCSRVLQQNLPIMSPTTECTAHLCRQQKLLRLARRQAQSWQAERQTSDA